MSVSSCTPPTPAAMADAAARLRAGDLAILPTDTVYGLFADVTDDRAVEAIWAAKGKPQDAPLQLVFPRSAKGLERFAVVTEPVRRFVEMAGPGGWTVIAPAAPGWTSPALAGGATVGFRLPNHDVLDGVMEALGGPACASSANVHGGASPATCADAITQVGEHAAMALDGGAAAGLSSTVIDLTGDKPVILREGALNRVDVARILGVPRVEVVRSEREGERR